MPTILSVALTYYVPGVFLLSLFLSTVSLLIGAYGVLKYALKAVRS